MRDRHGNEIRDGDVVRIRYYDLDERNIKVLLWVYKDGEFHPLNHDEEIDIEFIERVGRIDDFFGRGG